MQSSVRRAAVAALLTLLAGAEASAQTIGGTGATQMAEIAAPSTTPASIAPASIAPPLATPQLATRRLALDVAGLPPMPRIVPKADRDRAVLMAAGAGAAAGVILVDLLSGGLLLLPLGLPTFSALNGAAAAVPAAGWSVAQRLLAGVATSASALGGGFTGSRIVTSEFAPDVPQ